MPLWVKKGTLKFPKEKDTPVIMVGPGTGVAPFRSAVQERIAEGKNGEIFTSLTLSLTLTSFCNSDMTHLLLVSLLFSQRPVLRLSL